MPFFIEGAGVRGCEGAVLQVVVVPRVAFVFELQRIAAVAVVASQAHIVGAGTERVDGECYGGVVAL